MWYWVAIAQKSAVKIVEREDKVQYALSKQDIYYHAHLQI